MFVYARKASPSVGRCQGEKLARAIEWLERRVGIKPIRRVQRILRIVFVGGVERVIGTVAIRWIHGVPWIIAVRGVEGIVGRVGLGWVQRVVRCRLTGRGEDIVVALILLGEAGVGECRRDGEEERQQKEDDDPHGEPPTSRTFVQLAYSSTGDERKRGQNVPPSLPQAEGIERNKDCVGRSRAGFDGNSVS